MTDVHLFYCNPWVRHGGHVTYTVHLMIALRAAGMTPHLYKIRPRTETFTRDFGYGERYRNISIKDVKKLRRRKNSRWLITAPSKPAAEDINGLLKLGIPIVIHDPAEFEHGWDCSMAYALGPVVIRKNVKELVPNSTFIPHPYQPWFVSMPHGARKKMGITLSRIDWDKNTEMILDANRLLGKRSQIELLGAENRLYTKFRIMPKYPEFVQGSTSGTNPRVFARDLGTAPSIASRAVFMFDMSVIKNDGGGTQYSFLEAIDGGAVCVLNAEWIIKGGVMVPGHNCLQATSGKQIAKMIQMYRRDPAFQHQIDQISRTAHGMLKTHMPKRVGMMYRRYFDV